MAPVGESCPESTSVLVPPKENENQADATPFSEEEIWRDEDCPSESHWREWDEWSWEPLVKGGDTRRAATLPTCCSVEELARDARGRSWRAWIVRGSRTAVGCTVWLIVVGAILRFWAASAVGLGYGESYYFSCAIRPALSYFDHPPLAMILARASMALTGSVGPLALRGPFILLFAGTTWLMFLLGRQLFGSWPGFWAALLLNLSPVFGLTTAACLQPDGPLMFFWLACTCCLVRIFLGPQLRRPCCWWSLVGLTLGLALLSKYHAVLLVAGAGLFVLTRREQWHWLIHPGPYLALALATAIFAPVLIWNSQHQWISFLWQGARGLQSQGFRWDWLLRSAGGQALWILPWIWAPLLWELPWSFCRGATSRATGNPRWLIAWLALTPIVLFTAISSYAPIGFHFHWQAPGYLLLFLPLGATLHERLQRNHALSRRWLTATVACSLVGLTVITTHSATGWWSALGPRWLAEKFNEADDPTLECLDYAPLAGVLDTHGLLDREDVFVFTNRWFQSGKVDYALGGRLPVLCLNPWDPRGYAFWETSEQCLGKDGILVSTKRFIEEPTSWYGKHFDKIEPLQTVAVTRGQVTGDTLRLYYCHKLRVPYTQPY